ncbi:invasion associated locus B family protein [Maritimibacter sp. 55A14]|uniref:invasion associated locus B family protein n=1 Tax=Maritimibacter sp. 55A14 TaxID=2174844 RepID=UPI000D603A11|nr:invasion associated locus B family protein [Maritimibacter sp. 55A14]PWE33191.1 invasion associated locus B family protein [Maritimibacter sp. 55A14]
MSKTLRVIALLLATGIAGMAQAQEDGAATEAEPEADAGGLSMGEEATPLVGDTYRASTHGAWQINCVKTEEEKDPCQMYQLIKDPQGNPVAELTVFDVPNGAQAVAGATVVSPLGTLLTTQMTLAIGDGQGKRYPFSWCDQAGCVSRLGLTGAELLALQNGTSATVTIRSIQAPDQKINLDVSLEGFTAAFKEIQVPNTQ